MNPEESAKQKLERYQKTKELTDQIRFNQESRPHSAAGEPATQADTATLLQAQAAVSRNDMDFVRSYIKTLSEFDPANPLYTNFLRKESVTWNEFQEIVNNFAANHSSLVRMQDQINNLRLAAGEASETDQESPQGIEETEATDNSQPEDYQPPQQSSEQEGSSTPQDQQKKAAQEPRRVIIQRPQKPQYGMNKEEYGKYKAENKEERDARARQLWAQRRAARSSPNEDEDDEKKRNLRRPGENQAPGRNPLGDKIDNWAKNKFNNSRAGKSLDRLNNRFGNTRVGRAINAPSRLGTNISNRFGNTNLGRGVTRFNNLLNAPSRFLNSVASRLGNFAGNAIRNLGSQAVRGGVNLASQGLSNLSSQAAGQAARGAASTAVRGLAIILFNPITWIIIFMAVLFFFIFWQAGELDKSANSECGQPGTIQVLKEHKGTGQDLTLPNRPDSTSNIEYEIVVTYNIKCVQGMTDIEVRDPLPTNTTYVSSSSIVNRLPADQYTPTEQSEAAAQGKLEGNTVVWRIKNLLPQREAVLSLVIAPSEAANNSWVTNEVTVSSHPYSPGISGGGVDFPNTPPPADWDNIKARIIDAFNNHPELFNIYKEASTYTGIPWQFLAGLHFVETGSNPRGGTSLVSGRFIGEVEPDISPAKCAEGHDGPGVPIPIGGGCGFSTQTQSAIYAANHLAEKIGKIPSTFAEAVEAISRYNGGGNANCGEGLDYAGACPPPFYGEDDPYAMADFDESHSSKAMYLLFCGDGKRCAPAPFNRPGAMGVVRALMEAGL